jgi:8-oxo-dGTP pyrophosphatase MutT (NUDIX family)
MRMESKEDSFHLGVKGLIHNSEGKLLLLYKRSRSPYWDIPGGRMHKNESLEEALKREVAEETGLQISRTAPLLMILSHGSRIPVGSGDVGLIYAAYLCKAADETASIRLSEEHTDFGWFEPRKAAELLTVKFPLEIVDAVSKLDPSALIF